MEYKDMLGVDIKKGDYIVYASTKGELQLGRVLALTKTKCSSWMDTSQSTHYPTIKITAARREWVGGSISNGGGEVFKKLPKASTLSKLDNVLVIKSDLPISMVLF